MSAFRIECPKCSATWAMPDQYPVDHIEFCPECQTAFDPRNAPAPTQSVPVLDAVKPKKRMIAMIAGGGTALLVLVGVVIWINVASSNANVAKDDPANRAASTETTTDTPTKDRNGTKPSASQIDARILGPSVPFAQQVSYAPSTSGLTYSWPVGVKQVCKFEYEIAVGNVIHGTSGQIDYEPTRTRPSSVISAAEPEGGDEGSGSAFVVRPDGFLVTCAHVLIGAVEIKVQLGNRTYSAKVVDLDVPNDLALLRIAADKLPYLTILDSDNVRLAEDVRAIGYPLSDLLGESITVSRGTVSAIIRQEGESLLQLDARVNPGNSGGPIVNEKGQVVGVASAMMDGEEIASIGFAVPSNKVRSLLEKQNVRYRTADSSINTLAGPELAAQVTPAVALVKVKLGPSGLGIAQEKVVRFSGTWNSYVRSTTSQAKRPVDSTRESGVLLVDSKGQVSYCSGTKTLPAFAGLVGLVGIVPLPDDDSKEWQTGRMHLVTQTTTTDAPEPGSLPDLNSLRSYRNPYSRPDPTVEPQTQGSPLVHPAVEMATYKIADKPGQMLSIQKTYEFQTVHSQGEPVYCRSQGSGTIYFDKHLGRIQAQVYKGHLQLASQNPFPFRMLVTNNLPKTEQLANNPAPILNSEPPRPNTLPPREEIETVDRAEPDAAQNAARWVIEMGGKAGGMAGKNGFTLKDPTDIPVEPFMFRYVYFDTQHSTDHNDKVDDMGLSTLQGADGLKYFRLSRSSRVSDAGLSVLQEFPGIESVSVKECPRVAGEFLQHLSSATQLKYLVLSGSAITDEGLAVLVHGDFPNLVQLDLQATKITDAALKHVAQLKAVTNLVVAGTAITDKGMEHIAKMKQLQRLGIWDVELSAGGIKNISELPNLNYLNIRCKSVSDDAVGHLTGMRNMTQLMLNGTSITDKGVAELAKMMALQTLQFAGCKLITDEGFRNLAALKNLRSLNVYETNISDAMIRELHSALPGCQVLHDRNFRLGER